MTRRAFIVVLDAVGAGELPDAAEFGDAGSNTLGHVAHAVGGLDLPHLQELGLGNVLPLEGCPPEAAAPSVAGRLLEHSRGKDTTVGHWEIAGIVTERAFPTYPDGFPQELLDAFSQATGRGVIGNAAASGTEIIERLGEEHQRTGKWIVYTSADSVFQIAAHETTVPLEELYEACRRARELLTGEHAVGRVIARPFEGEPGAYRRTANRHDFSLVPPRPNHLSRIREAGVRVTGVGKIGDVFAGQDIDDSQPTHSNAEGLERTIELARAGGEGLIFVNLVETDMTYGHRNDPIGFHRCLQEIDAAIPALRAALGPDDLLLLTSDHGCDPTTPSTDHSREYALLIAHAPGRAPGGRHDGEFADVGASAAAWLGARPGDGLPGNADRAGTVVLRAVELIERKRDGAEHADGEIAWLVEGYVAGRVAAEQMSAWAMAVVFRGLSDAETHALTRAMVESGTTIDLSSLGRTVVDKHSTGGVGDKTTIALAPLAAAMGMPVAKLSGRGLAHTGGTLDKLESIPGFRVGLSSEELIAQVGRIGCAVAAQTSDLVPADRMLYALRDVTGTVPASGLIAASVMSKKLAAGADAILLDVKVGEGAFMADVGSARELAVRMRDIGVRAGRPTVCELTAMDSPLGAAVGNALEVAEACEMLAGRGPDDLRELVLGSAARMAVLSDLGVELAEGRRLAEAAIVSGEALRALERLLEAQGGDPRLAERPWEILAMAPVSLAVSAPRAASVTRCGALAIGRAAMRLGAGRERKEDVIDHAVGIVVHAKPGDAVEAGEPLAHVFARDAAAAEAAAAEVLAAYAFSEGAVERPALLLETVG